MFDSLNRALGLQARTRGTARYPRSGTPLEVVHRKGTPKSKRHAADTQAGPVRAMVDPMRTLGHPPRPRKRGRR
jgi:hypothetical protein